MTTNVTGINANARRLRRQRIGWATTTMSSTGSMNTACSLKLIATPMNTAAHTVRLRNW